ncbi:MAG: 50S ribosomal protein L11 methyltransferase [Georgfuchsia sp.]
MWVNVSIRTRAELAEALSEALLERGALSVSVEDADAGTERETPQFGEPGSPATPLWDNSKVVALFEPAHDLIGIVTAAAHEIGLDDLPDIELEDVAEENWVQLTQAQFEPIKIDDRLWIVPTWHQAPDPTAINLQLDPGMAFGTGSHPTTRLCLEWLLNVVSQGDTLLDYGCGSGILAIASAKLGASQVVGIEIDEQAIAAAQGNAVQNAVMIDLRHSSKALPETFDLVVANILTNPLCILAPLLAGRVAPGGRLALSGVLESQAQQVIDAYAPYIRLRTGAVREGWCRLEGSSD